MARFGNVSYRLGQVRISGAIPNSAYPRCERILLRRPNGVHNGMGYCVGEGLRDGAVAKNSGVRAGNASIVPGPAEPGRRVKL